MITSALSTYGWRNEGFDVCVVIWHTNNYTVFFFSFFLVGTMANVLQQKITSFEFRCSAVVVLLLKIEKRYVWMVGRHGLIFHIPRPGPVPVRVRVVSTNLSTLS